MRYEIFSMAYASIAISTETEEACGFTDKLLSFSKQGGRMMITCPYCGVQQEESDSIYCENCGQLLPALHPEIEPPKTQNHPFRFWLLLLIGLPVLVILATAAFVRYQNDTEQSDTTTPSETGIMHTFYDRSEQAVFICENADRFTETELQTMSDELRKTSETLQMAVGVRIGETPLTNQAAAREISISDFQQEFATAESGVWLYLDFSASVAESDYEVYDYLLTYGSAQLYYTNAPDNDRISEIFSQLNPMLQRGEEDGVQAVKQFCAALISYAEAGIPEEYYVYDADTGQYLYEENDLISWHDTPPNWEK